AKACGSSFRRPYLAQGRAECRVQLHGPLRVLRLQLSAVKLSSVPMPAAGSPRVRGQPCAHLQTPLSSTASQHGDTRRGRSAAPSRRVRCTPLLDNTAAGSVVGEIEGATGGAQGAVGLPPPPANHPPTPVLPPSG